MFIILPAANPPTPKASNNFPTRSIQREASNAEGIQRAASNIPMFFNRNGSFFRDEVPAARGSHYGYGPVETMLLQEGAIRLAPYHWERLLHAATTLKMQLPAGMNAAFLEGEVLRTAAKNKLERMARIRLRLYNDNGGLLEKAGGNTGFVIQCAVIKERATRLNDTGLTTGIATGVRKAADAISNIKTSGRLIYEMAGREAIKNNWDDALLLNTAGNVAESTIANLFWVADGIVYTSPLHDGCVSGVMRQHLLTALPVLGIEVRQATISPQGLKSVENIFLSNAIRGIRWVSMCDNQPLKKGIANDINAQIF